MKQRSSCFSLERANPCYLHIYYYTFMPHRLRYIMCFEGSLNYTICKVLDCLLRSSRPTSSLTLDFPNRLRTVSTGQFTPSGCIQDTDKYVPTTIVCYYWLASLVPRKVQTVLSVATENSLAMGLQSWPIQARSEVILSVIPLGIQTTGTSGTKLQLKKQARTEPRGGYVDYSDFGPSRIPHYANSCSTTFDLHGFSQSSDFLMAGRSLLDIGFAGSSSSLTCFENKEEGCDGPNISTKTTLAGLGVSREVM